MKREKKQRRYRDRSWKTDRKKIGNKCWKKDRSERGKEGEVERKKRERKERGL
jgi:hypothetical protein